LLRKKEMSGRGRGRGRRVTIIKARGGGTAGLSLNDRFSQYKNKGISPATRASRRGAMTVRGNDARFSSLMEKRTGRKQPVNKTTSQNTFQTRRGRGFGRGNSRGTTTFRTGRGGRRGGIRRNAASRGGRKKKQNVSQEDLDADLDSYMGGNEKVASQKLDDDLDSYMADRADPNVKA